MSVREVPVISKHKNPSRPNLIKEKKRKEENYKAPVTYREPYVIAEMQVFNFVPISIHNRYGFSSIFSR
jgi:hypothetical protein